MSQQTTTPEFTNYDEDTGRINFTAFRKYYQLSSATTRIICKSLGYTIIREGAEQYIVGENQFNVSNSYFRRY